MKITTSAETSTVIFSYIEEFAGKDDMKIGYDLEDEEGRKLLSFYKDAEFPSKEIYISIQRKKIDKAGRITYLVSVDFWGGTEFPERGRNRVDDYFDTVVNDIKALENEGYLVIEKIH